MGKFQELLPTLTSHALLYVTRWQRYSTCICPVLYASECWVSSFNDLLKLDHNDHAIVWWICNVHLKDHISSDSLLEKLGLNNMQKLLQYNLLRWFGHVARHDGCIKNITALVADGHHG